MCLAIPGQIKSIEGRKAIVQYSDLVREALVGENNLKAGDWVMVQMGVIAKVISVKEAKKMLKVWKEIEGK